MTKDVQSDKSLKAFFLIQAFPFASLLWDLVILLCLGLLLFWLPQCVSCISLYQLQLNWSNLIVPFVMQHIFLWLAWLIIYVRMHEPSCKLPVKICLEKRMAVLKMSLILYLNFQRHIPHVSVSDFTKLYFIQV